MSTLHSKKAASALKNVDKITRHDQTFWLMRGKRDLMEHKLPEWESLREHASEIKRHTATHLTQYLEQFSKKLESNGVIVHWAEDVREFNQIVLEILQKHEVKRLVKSKSMLTEECELNPYLETQGIHVVETDLGERILQLLDEKPSHIVVPPYTLRVKRWESCSSVRV